MIVVVSLLILVPFKGEDNSYLKPSIKQDHIDSDDDDDHNSDGNIRDYNDKYKMTRVAMRICEES